MNNRGKSTPQTWALLVGFMIFVLIVAVIYVLILQHYLPNYAIRGQFGDMFGMLNSIFSGLAFSGVIYALFLQRKDLEFQRTELSLARKEYKRIADSQEVAHRLNILIQKIQASQHILDFGRASLAKTQGVALNEEEMAAAAGMNLAILAQAEKLGQFYAELEELEQALCPTS